LEVLPAAHDVNWLHSSNKTSSIRPLTPGIDHSHASANSANCGCLSNRAGACHGPAPVGGCDRDRRRTGGEGRQVHQTSQSIECASDSSCRLGLGSAGRPLSTEMPTLMAGRRPELTDSEVRRIDHVIEIHVGWDVGRTRSPAGVFDDRAGGHGCPCPWHRRALAALSSRRLWQLETSPGVAFTPGRAPTAADIWR